MAGKFINTTTAYSQVVNQASQVTKSRLDNPYYIFSDKKASECTYYNINTTMTTLDEATRGNYAEISNESPIRFNKIKGFYIYGITRMEPNLDVGEFGVEGEISGEAFILPRTLIPFPGDYFTLSQLGDGYVFRVTGVNPNTLDTGATAYRVTYVLQSSDATKSLEPQVVKTYIFNLNTGGIDSDNGSNISASIIDEEAYNKATEFQNYVTALKDYYISLFYDAKVQTFTYYTNPHSDLWHQTMGEPKISHIANLQDGSHPFGIKVYDPYLIEFIIRNSIVNNASMYLHIDQQMFLPTTFALDYSRTIFSSLEDKNINKHYGYSVGNLLLCDQRLSLLYAHPENYYYMKYDNLNARLYYISIFDDPEMASHIRNNKTIGHPLWDIMIKYFNNVELTIEDLKELDHIDYMSNREFFYGIPMAIYCIEQQIAKDLSGSTLDISTTSDGS